MPNLRTRNGNQRPQGMLPLLPCCCRVTALLRPDLQPGQTKAHIRCPAATVLALCHIIHATVEWGAPLPIAMLLAHVPQPLGS